MYQLKTKQKLQLHSKLQYFADKKKGAFVGALLFW